MPFLGQNMTPIGGNARSGALIDLNAPMGWGYQSSTDDLATVLVTGYFDTFNLYLQAGHFIYLNLTDGKFIATVSAVDKVLKTVELDEGVFSPIAAGEGSFGGYSFAEQAGSQTFAALNNYVDVSLSGMTGFPISNLNGWETNLNTGQITRLGESTRALIGLIVSGTSAVKEKSWGFKVGINTSFSGISRGTLSMPLAGFLATSTTSEIFSINQGDIVVIKVAALTTAATVLSITDIRVTITDAL